MPLFEIERQTTFVNTNYHLNKIENITNQNKNSKIIEEESKCG